MRFHLTALLLSGLACTEVAAQTKTFDLPRLSETTFKATEADGLTVGYARIQAAARQGNLGLPSGMAIFSNRKDGVLISEASVPIQPLVSSGRIYVDVKGSTNTGIAIANPNAQELTVDFFFTDGNGNNVGLGSTTIAANSQISRFLTEAPFFGSGDFQGTFTFTSTLPVSAIALRGVTNERNEFLMTTLPIAVTSSHQISSQLIPQFADGGGWKTSIVLINPTEGTITGEIKAYSGQPLAVTLNGATSSVFRYLISPRSSAVFTSTGGGADVQTGFVSIDPDEGYVQPVGFAIFRRSENGATISEASVPAVVPGTSWSVFVESSGNLGEPGSMQSGIAIASNRTVNSVPDFATFSLHGADGELIATTPPIEVQPHWHQSLFLDQIPGLPKMAPPFQGLLRVFIVGTRFTPPSVSVTGLRGRYNERNEFLVTTTSPIKEVFATPSPELLFPHFAVGAGYETQFVLFTERGATGTAYFFNQDGSPAVLPLR